MLNRYFGNSGRVIRMEEPAAPSPEPKKAAAPPTPGGMIPLGASRGAFLGSVSELFSRVSRHMETEDLTLIAMLYLLYRESGDEEWLLMIGVLLFL